MPIRPENKDLYPKNWAEVRAAILSRANNRCEQCGLPNHSYGYRDLAGKFVHVHRGQRPPEGTRPFIVRLTIMHLDHDPTNNDPKNLKAACEKCHNKYDAPVRAANRKRRLRREYERIQRMIFESD